MPKLLLIGLTALLPFGASAQQVFQAPAQNSPSSQQVADALKQEVRQVSVVSINGLNCPIAASAERGGAGGLIETRKDDVGRSENNLHLHFARLTSGVRSSIAEASITLHGNDGRPRAELAYSSARGTLTEDFHLTSAADHGLTSASVTPTRVVNVRWIAISELKFADGSTWHPSESSYCHIRPNGFRLVDAAR